jgi:chromosome partitioning protein
VTLSIIDTPALESPAALAAVTRADLTIVPVKPSALDIWAAVVTGRRMNVLGEKFAFLLNQCPKQRQSRRMRTSIAELEAAGPLLVPQIGMSQRFLEAVAQGKGVTEIDPKGGTAQEMRSLGLQSRIGFCLRRRAIKRCRTAHPPIIVVITSPPRAIVSFQ